MPGSLQLYETVSRVGRWSIPPAPGQESFGVPRAGVGLPHTTCEMRRLLASVSTHESGKERESDEIKVSIQT